MDKIIETIYKGILEGDQDLVGQNVNKGLSAGLSPNLILDSGMIAAMGEVGQLFENGEYFLPEMIIAAHAMQAGLKQLKPHLSDTSVQATGRVVIGTVAGDLHDIGKNLVSIMMEGAGFEMIDLGTDIKPGTFVDAVREHKPDILAMSALLTTTMSNMEITIKALETAGLRGQVKVLIGGAPITEEYAGKIGADGFGANASLAVKAARSLIREE